MTIDELAQRESELLDQIYNAQGSIEDKVGQLREGGVFDAYQQVHSNYAVLAKENSEALKRGLFLQWSAMVEPSFVSGVHDLDPQAQKQIIGILDKQIGLNKIDTELYSMLSFYASWEYVFERFSNCKNLDQLLHNRLDYDPIMRQLKQSNLDRRGRMGVYWQSIIRD